ncbi:MAG: ATP-grasp domain-containing protein [Methanocellales archaeon]
MYRKSEVKKSLGNKKVLIMGFNSRPIACSAKRAGYLVYAVDGFRDIDLERCAEDCLTFKGKPTVAIAREAVEKFKFDFLVIGSGFEFIDLGVESSKILGNHPEVAKKVSNKEWLAKKLMELGIQTPRIYSVDAVEFPAVLKPKTGGGGYLNILARGREDLPPEDVLGGMLIQQYIPGKAASVSVLSTKEEAFALAVNEQLLGLKWLNQINIFGYCGNITPLKTKFEAQLKRIAEEIVLELGLIGSNGVDFVIARNGAYLIEVNPRFQGSLDTVEIATGINMFEAHVKACEGELITRPRMKQFGVKMIVYAAQRTRIKSSLDVAGIADIPRVGRIIDKGEAVATALGWGKTRGSAVEMARARVEMIKAACERW